MAKYNVSKKFRHSGRLSRKAIDVMRMFGVMADRLNENKFAINCQVEIKDGDIVVLTAAGIGWAWNAGVIKWG